MVVYIEEYRQMPKVNFYTVRLENEEDSETDRFISRFIASHEYRPDLEVILAALEEIGARRGALPPGDATFFRPERDAVALPPPQAYGNLLRLYGFICSDDIMVLGGGGRKTTKKAQDGDTRPAFRMMNQVAEILKHRLKNQTVWIENQQLHGAYHQMNLPG
ncbi:hypothetical protein MON38_14920 [Hymenobacter sp. DH14]|uniref:Uncharacterized protein n=1 Tax=Hymenobacter cyanobacteriorum TaxID=2926463 RepID=A0A9X1VI56_9BACT|nr:hypothetical protein [Hymenobacter cyanobacteriorum]MCI1188717.1 hypothetical protein [Hymenobacter cyanobacteriorum]